MRTWRNPGFTGEPPSPFAMNLTRNMLSLTGETRVLLPVHKEGYINSMISHPTKEGLVEYKACGFRDRTEVET